jgi:hypothetical protein
MADAFLDPLKIGFEGLMSRYFEDLLPMTTGAQAFIARGFGGSIAWAPSRMVDQAEDMVGQWLRDSDTPKAPGMIVAIGKDWIPTGRDFARQETEKIPFQLSERDPRIFRLQTIAADFRVQIVIFGHQISDVRSLAAQMTLFLDHYRNRRFSAEYSFKDEVSEWPVTIETPEVMFGNVPTDAKNLTILAGDLTLKAVLPLFHESTTSNDGSYPVAILGNLISGVSTK